MDIKLKQEIDFLKKFKKRFKTTKEFEEAIEDLYNEGLITLKAYFYISKELELLNNDDKKPIIKKKISNIDTTIDPCTRHPTKTIDPCTRNTTRC